MSWHSFFWRLFRSRLISTIVLLMGLIVTLIGYGYASHIEHTRIRDAFNQFSYLKTQLVLFRVEGAERGLVDIRGLFVAREKVSEDEFFRYLDGVGMLDRFPAIRISGYAPLATSHNRIAIANYLTHKLGKTIPINSLPAIPILYVYPQDIGAIGMELGNDDARRDAMNAARDTGEGRISRPVHLRFDRLHKIGFVIYVPIYQNGLPSSTVLERQQALAGYLFSSFRVEDLITATIWKDIDNELNIEVFYGAKADPSQLIFQSKRVNSDSAPLEKERYTNLQRIQVLGHTWTFRFTPNENYLAANRANFPLAVLIGGTTVSMLAAWLAKIFSSYLAAVERVRYLAFYDELTGIPNRTKLRKVLNEEVIKYGRNNTPFVLLIIELVRFRQINYTLGHLIGDELLKQVTLRLKDFANHDCYLARIGNVQFALLTLKKEICNAEKIAKAITGSFEKPFSVSGIQYELGSHVGVAVFPDSGDNAEALLRHTDVALNTAKVTGKDYVIYEESDDSYSVHQLSLLGDLRKAIKEKQIQLFYQPKVNIKNSQVTSVEALIRWRHPNLGLVLPDRFIPLIEPTTLIHPLTLCVIEAAIEQSAAWRKSAINIPIAINLSARNLLNAELPDLIQRMVQKMSGEMSWIQLEITESSLMVDPVASVRVLNQLHAMGLKLAIDDYGTGYSSLTYLMELPVDILKIDYSFTRSMIRNQDAATIVKSTIEMAHNMGITVVAEGAENQEIWNALKRLNCDEAQGYFISRAIPASEFSQWLFTTSWRMPPTKSMLPATRNS
jgi:diguanylate cyclase (GGDEF)-like protein